MPELGLVPALQLLHGPVRQAQQHRVLQVCRPDRDGCDRGQIISNQNMFSATQRGIPTFRYIIWLYKYFHFVDNVLDMVVGGKGHLGISNDVFTQWFDCLVQAGTQVGLGGGVNRCVDGLFIFLFRMNCCSHTAGQTR